MGLIADSVMRHVPVRLSLELLSQAFSEYPRQDFQVRLWDSSTWGTAENPRFILHVKSPSALRQMLVSPDELNLGEAYIRDHFDVLGDLEAAIEMGDYLLSQQRVVLPASLRIASLLNNSIPGSISEVQRVDLEAHGQLHSRKRDRQAISYHYDLPPEFFALWLDRHNVYSCAYFEREDADLDTAQTRKLDYLCQKLRLRPSDRLLDIGCGWGGLLIHAAANYRVRALGITLSIRQAEMARQRIRDAGVNDRCRVDVCDYRDLEFDRQFDKIVSVGMFEHVGERQLAEYFSRAWQLLRPGGIFVNTGISASGNYQRKGPSFIDNYVFPDGDLVPISISLRAAELSSFEVRDVENLREHYALTLRHWVRRLEAHAEEAQRIVGQATYRIWRLYMAASAHAFQTGRLNLYHTIMVKPHNGMSGMPLTRADWYQQEQEQSDSPAA
jgi:cyclopropane-fatty-acyl-phospholipid synthase